MTTKELKKTHSYIWVGREEKWKCGTDSLIPMQGGHKSVGIPWEQGIPAPLETTQLRIPVLGR